MRPERRPACRSVGKQGRTPPGVHVLRRRGAGDGRSSLGVPPRPGQSRRCAPDARSKFDGVTAVDVEEVAGDVRGFVGGDEDDRVGTSSCEAEATERDLRSDRAAFFSVVPVKRVSMPVSVGPGATPFTRHFTA